MTSILLPTLRSLEGETLSTRKGVPSMGGHLHPVNVPLRRAVSQTGSLEKIGRTAGLIDENVCPTLLSKNLRARGAGVFACRLIFTDSWNRFRVFCPVLF